MVNIMREIEKLQAGLEYCFFDEEVAMRKRSAVIACQKYNAIDAADVKKREEATRKLRWAQRLQWHCWLSAYYFI